MTPHPRQGDRVGQCFKTRDGLVCALDAGHKGPCGHTQLQVEQYRQRDAYRKRAGGGSKIHKPDPNRN